jgi:hypothetical protein
MQYETATGIIEITPHPDTTGIVIKSPFHEVGINIPKSSSWSFLNHQYYEGSHESVEVTDRVTNQKEYKMNPQDCLAGYEFGCRILAKQAKKSLKPQYPHIRVVHINNIFYLTIHKK